VREGEAPAAGWCTSGAPGSGDALGREQQGAGEARVAWRYKLVRERLGRRCQSLPTLEENGCESNCWV
jgi:hypothetical protein